MNFLRLLLFYYHKCRDLGKKYLLMCIITKKFKVNVNLYIMLCITAEPKAPAWS